MRGISSRTVSKIAGSARRWKRVNRLRGGIPLGNPGPRKPLRRDNAPTSLPPIRQIAHQKGRVIKYNQARVVKPSSRVSPPAKHMVAGGPIEKTYPLYSADGYIGECTIVKVRSARIARAGMNRFKVAIEGKVVGMAAKVGGHMKLLHRA